MNSANHGAGFSVSGVGYRAGIDDNNIRAVPLLGFLKAIIQESLFQSGAIGLSRSAPEINNFESL